MAEVKWIKIVTDIFDDEKILLIETLPEADSIIVIWFKLLCLAGKQNNKGVFMMNDKIPYTERMLATIFRRKETTIQLALKTFEEFGMIEIVNGVITIPNWSKHQNLDKIEKNNEYMRNYMRERRAKQKLLAQGITDEEEDSKEDVNLNSKTNSKTNVSGLDKNRIDKNKNRIDKNKKYKYGEYQRIELTDNEYNKLCDDFGEEFIKNQISLLDEYVESNNNKNKYKNFNLVLRKSIRENWFKTNNKNSTNNQNNKTNTGNPFFDLLREEGKMQ